MSGIDFDLAEWAFLPPLDDADLPSEPPPAREYGGGVTLGSDLADAAWLSRVPSPAGEAADLGRAVHADLVAVHPGLAELARLGSIDLDGLDAVARMDILVAVDRLESWLSARKQELLALISTRDRSEQHWCVEEVGAALRLAGSAARTVLADAEQLIDRLPGTLAALSDGRLNPAQATAITRGSYPLPDHLLPEFESRVLARADGQSITGLKRSITRTVLALDPATAEQKHQHALQDRQVRIAPAEHGMAWLMALLPAEQAQAIFARLTSTARTTAQDHADRNRARVADNQAVAADRPGPINDDDARTLDQLRADLLAVSLLTDLDPQASTRPGVTPAVNVIVSLTTLAGTDDEPGWLDNYGPITAGHARQLAHDPTGTWRRLVTDPVDGQLLDYGTTRYKPPRHLADHVTARDGECTFPYCTHTARRADLDHMTPYPDGPTATGNLHPLHRRHHNAKTHGGWRPSRSGATTTWTSPQGRSYRTSPPQRWTTPDPPPF